MENLASPTLLSKIFDLSNLFNLHPSTDFSYTYWIIGLVVYMIVASFIFDHVAKNLENKFLRKALRNRTFHFKVTFPFFAVVMLISRLEGIPFLSMKIWWIVWIIAIIAYKVKLMLNIKKEYNSRLKNKEKFDQK